MTGADSDEQTQNSVAPPRRPAASRFPTTAPIVVFTHRPLFDLRPDREWFTGGGDEVMNALAPYENVTVLYGHIHREHTHTEGHATHIANTRAPSASRNC